MLKSPKSKGRRGEAEAMKALEAIGLKARKQPLSGALVEFPYDLRVWHGEQRFSCEVKRYKRPAAVEKLRNGADMLLYRPDNGAWGVWMPLETLRELLS